MSTQALEPAARTPSPTVRRRGEPTWEVAFLFPAQGNWTEADYLSLDTNRLVELSGGCLEVLPVPTPLHQFIVKFLLKILDAFVEAHTLGHVLCAPLPVRLWQGQLREPDVLYLKPERLPDRRQQPNGADLVMEVVSEGEENRDRDLRVKREEYARAGIAEYWIVDPQHHQITVLTLQGGQYVEHGVFRPGASATSLVLQGFAVDVAAVFRYAEEDGA